MTPLFATSIYWDLPVMLIVFSLVYSATRHDRWDRILVEAAGWAFRVAGFLALIGVTLYVLSTYPNRWPYLAAALAVIGIGSFVLPAMIEKRMNRPSGTT